MASGFSRPIGDDRLNLPRKHDRQEAERKQRVDTATAGELIAEDHPHWLVDRKALRGVPCAGRGVGGAIAESIPGWNLFDDDE